MNDEQIEEDFDDFYDAYEVTPLGYLLAGVGAGLVVTVLCGLAWWALK